MIRELGDINFYSSTMLYILNNKGYQVIVNNFTVIYMFSKDCVSRNSYISVFVYKLGQKSMYWTIIYYIFTL